MFSPASEPAIVMGIRFECPNGHKLNVKAHLAGERGICPHCDSRFIVPAEDSGAVAAERPVEAYPPAVEQSAEQDPIESESAEQPEQVEVESIIDTSVVPPKLPRTSRRSRQERARRQTLVLAAMFFALIVALIFVLQK